MVPWPLSPSLHFYSIHVNVVFQLYLSLSYAHQWFIDNFLSWFMLSQYGFGCIVVIYSLFFFAAYIGKSSMWAACSTFGRISRRQRSRFLNLLKTMMMFSSIDHLQTMALNQTLHTWLKCLPWPTHLGGMKRDGHQGSICHSLAILRSRQKIL